MYMPLRFTPVLPSAALLAALALLPGGLAAQIELPAAEQYQEQMHAAWRQTMHRTPSPQGGCFHATYPGTDWEKVECAAPPVYQSARPRLRTPTTGNGYDYVAQASSGHTFSSVVGSFPAVKDVTSEKGANVPFGDGESSGITGANQYTLQVNTNITAVALLTKIFAAGDQQLLSPPCTWQSAA